MRVSSPTQMRWVIDRAEIKTIRSVKAMAAEHGVRMAEVVDAIIEDAWERYCAGEQIGPHFDDLVAKP